MFMMATQGGNGAVLQNLLFSFCFPPFAAALDGRGSGTPLLNTGSNHPDTLEADFVKTHNKT